MYLKNNLISNYYIYIVSSTRSPSDVKAIVTISTEAKPALTLIYGYIEINLKRGWPLHVDLSQQSELLNWKSNNTDPKPFQRHNSASNFIGTCFEPCL